jgi:hypothetical protein
VNYLSERNLGQLVYGSLAIFLGRTRAVLVWLRLVFV